MEKVKVIKKSKEEKSKKEYNVDISLLMFGTPTSFGCGQGTCNGK